ncbi:unknown protein [Seminavis robusta]|uniref:Uncharacterized protein n=1 Tax=Seminavis robusta TaxID=568900 RepID=A0A9N8EWQ0_9STRA|nr:unknown protein [Seminavis robusta]|eukprot:Sro1984_g309340.1 n/a (92) ;mRNA; f:10295-10651
MSATKNSTADPPAKIGSMIQIVDGVPTEFIFVDISGLEFTPGPFKIYPSNELPGVDDNMEHSGFFVTMRADVRDIMGAPKQVKDGVVIHKA